MRPRRISSHHETERRHMPASLRRRGEKSEINFQRERGRGRREDHSSRSCKRRKRLVRKEHEPLLFSDGSNRTAVDDGREREDSGIGASAVAAEVTRRNGFDDKIRLVTSEATTS